MGEQQERGAAVATGEGGPAAVSLWPAAVSFMADPEDLDFSCLMAWLSRRIQRDFFETFQGPFIIGSTEAVSQRQALDRAFQDERRRG